MEPRSLVLDGENGAEEALGVFVSRSDEQIAAILAAYTALVAVVTTVVRSKVSPVV